MTEPLLKRRQPRRTANRPRDFALEHHRAFLLPWASALALVLIVVLGNSGCDGCNGAIKADGSPFNDAPAFAQDATVAEMSSTDLRSVCPPTLRPSPVPASWLEYGDWSCNCRFYVPSSKADLPAPIQWEPCRGAVPDGLACRWMTVDWTTTDHAPIGPTPQGDVDAEGRVILRFTRFNQVSDSPSALFLVAEADGPVRTAILDAGGAHRGCALWDDDSRMHGGQVLWVVSGDNVHGNLETTTIAGQLGGSIDLLWPAVVARNDSDAAIGYEPGHDFLVQVGPYGKLRAPIGSGLGPPSLIYDPAIDPDGLPPRHLVQEHGAVFWRFNTLIFDSVMAWTQATGTQPLLRWPNDLSRGAFDFGTDGKDMVWVQGSGRTCCHDVDPFPTHDTMTAPFAADPAHLMPRRLRTDAESGPSGFGDYAVGCGMAAHTTGNGSLFVVRVADGRAWLQPVHPAGDGGGYDWAWANVLAITCDEVFATVQAGHTSQLARVRLDSLGPGVPAD